MRWLSECSVAALADAVAFVAPELAGAPIALPEPVGRTDPLWQASSAVVDGRFVVKFAWSRPAAYRIAHEGRVLTALAGRVPFVPGVVASATDPVLLVTRRLPGSSLFEVVDSIDRDRAGAQPAGFLAALHDPSTAGLLRCALGTFRDPRPAIADLPGLLAPRYAPVARWCAWADATLADPGPAVFTHGDLHGDNQVWHGDRLRLVVDFEMACFAEPEYDLRTLRGTGAGVELLTATLRHYPSATGRHLSVPRALAWHLRTASNDIVWRTAAGLPDRRTPEQRIDDLAVRFDALGVDPVT